jgi:polyhydroxyalkanoate synthesis regulator phasin
LDQPKPAHERGLPEALRAAIERTLAATAGQASETRERAQELLDEVARRGQEARERVTRQMRIASGEEVSGLLEQIEALEQRIAALERELEKAEPKVEGE